MNFLMCMYKNFISQTLSKQKRKTVKKKLVKDIKIYLKKKKKKKQDYGSERYKNLSKDEKQKPVEYRENIAKRVMT